jgi:hypothetical protein
VKFAMKKKISALKNQGNDNVVIDVESVLFMEKSVVIVQSTFYVLSATIYNRCRQINIDLCVPLNISFKPFF